MANELLHGGFIVSFMKFNIILIFIMTDLSASSDVIIINIRHHIFQGYIEESNSNFPHPQNSLLDLFTSYHFPLYRQILDLSS